MSETSIFIDGLSGLWLPHRFLKLTPVTGHEGGLRQLQWMTIRWGLKENGRLYHLALPTLSISVACRLLCHKGRQSCVEAPDASSRIIVRPVDLRANAMHMGYRIPVILAALTYPALINTTQQGQSASTAYGISGQGSSGKLVGQSMTYHRFRGCFSALAGQILVSSPPRFLQLLDRWDLVALELPATAMKFCQPSAEGASRVFPGRQWTRHGLRKIHMQYYQLPLVDDYSGLVFWGQCQASSIERHG
jgi:hypothetical protein